MMLKDKEMIGIYAEAIKVERGVFKFSQESSNTIGHCFRLRRFRQY
jgi:hypothetical protein